MNKRRKKGALIKMTETKNNSHANDDDDSVTFLQFLLAVLAIVVMSYILGAQSYVKSQNEQTVDYVKSQNLKADSKWKITLDKQDLEYIAKVENKDGQTHSVIITKAVYNMLQTGDSVDDYRKLEKTKFFDAVIESFK